MGIPVPNPIYLQALDGSTWLFAVNNSGQATTTPLTPPVGMPALPWIELNDIITGATRRLCVMPCPSVPSGTPGQLHSDLITPSVNGLPTQLLVSAPNAIIYLFQYNNGAFQSGLALPANASCNTPISTLAQNVLDRLEDPDGVFWLTQFEVYTKVVEALNDLTLLVGRPVIGVQTPFNLQPNSVWQSLPKGILCFTDIYGPQSLLRKLDLFSYDYVQFNSGSDWENDSSQYGPNTWAPLGVSMFIVHPAPSTPQTVTVNAIQYPAPVPWPYAGTITVPFHNEFFAAIESYAAHVLRFKELGTDFTASMALYADYLAQAQRMSVIEGRKDPLLFSLSLGAPFGTNAIQKR